MHQLYRDTTYNNASKLITQHQSNNSTKKFKKSRVLLALYKKNTYEKKTENKDNEVRLDEAGDLDFYAKSSGFGSNYVSGLYAFV